MLMHKTCFICALLPSGLVEVHCTWRTHTHHGWRYSEGVVVEARWFGGSSAVTLGCNASAFAAFCNAAALEGFPGGASKSRRLSSCRVTGSEGAGLASLALAAFGVDLELRACRSRSRSLSSYLTWVAT